MLAVQFSPENGFKRQVMPSQPLKTDEVRIKVDACGVCGSDRQIVRGEPAPLGTTFPLIMGHEISGTVIEVAPHVEDWKIGEAVIVYPFIKCGTCKACLQDESNLCYRQTCIGYHLPGGYAEEVVVPVSQLIHRPKNLSASSAALLVDAYATPYHAMKLSNIKQGDTVLIIGSGGLGLASIGLSHCFDVEKVAVLSRRELEEKDLVRLNGAQLMVYSKETLRQVARKLRRWSGSGGIDVVIDTMGNSESVSLATEVVRPGGTVTIVGMSTDSVQLPIMKMVRRGIHILTSYGSLQSDVEELIHFAEEKKFNPDDLIAGTLPLNRLEEAFTDSHRSSGRWMITP